MLDESGGQKSEVKNSVYEEILKESLSCGRSHQQLSGNTIVSWAKKICQIEGLQEIPANKDDSLEALGLTITQNVQQSERAAIENIVFSTGQILYACSTCSALSQIARKIELFVLLYVLSYHTLPLIFIKDSEQDYFTSCHRSPQEISVFLADKVRERCMSPQGIVFTRVSIPQEDNATETYQSDTGEKVSIEWHALFQAKRVWQQG